VLLNSTETRLNLPLAMATHFKRSSKFVRQKGELSRLIQLPRRRQNRQEHDLLVALERFALVKRRAITTEYASFFWDNHSVIFETKLTVGVVVKIGPENRPVVSFPS
jgi:hypothetical protein